jgi:hypothetical protein
VTLEGLPLGGNDSHHISPVLEKKEKTARGAINDHHALDRLRKVAEGAPSGEARASLRDVLKNKAAWDELMELPNKKPEGEPDDPVNKLFKDKSMDLSDTLKKDLTEKLKKFDK